MICIHCWSDDKSSVLSLVSDKKSILVIRRSDHRSGRRQNLIRVQSDRQLCTADQTFLLNEKWKIIFRSDLRSVSDPILDHFLDWFLSELRSNVVICCSANPFGLRINSDLFLLMSHSVLNQPMSVALVVTFKRMKTLPQRNVVKITNFADVLTTIRNWSNFTELQKYSQIKDCNHVLCA